MDLDGTLLNSDKHIDSELILYLKKIISKGIKVVLISGRHYEEMERYACEIGLGEETGYIVSCDGAYIRTGEGSILYQSELLTQQDILNFTDCCTRHSKVCFFDKNKDYVVGGGIETAAKKIFRTLKKNHRRVYLTKRQMRGENQNSFEKIVIRKKGGVSYDEYIKLKNFRKEYNIDYLSAGEVEIRSLSTGKLPAMQYIMKREEWKNEEIIVFGDDGNDIEMLSYFKNSYSMGNASERVKNSAHFVTDSNDRRGIYKALYVLFEKEYKE